MELEPMGRAVIAREGRRRWPWVVLMVLVGVGAMEARDGGGVAPGATERLEANVVDDVIEVIDDIIDTITGDDEEPAPGEESPDEW